MTGAQTPQPGFFGKLPARGDFVGRRLDQAFRTGFDEWLQKSIATSKRQLGGAWMPAYLNTPIWRFVLGPDLCGREPSLGVMMPSVDRVGRYFPLVVAAQLPGCLSPGTVFHSARAWFEAAERLILTTLDDAFDFEAFDRDVLAIGVPDYARAGEEPRGGGLRLDLHQEGDMSPTYARILDQVLMGNNMPFSLWWTQGSDRVRPSVLLSPGLPAPTNFAAFLDGEWDEWGWERPGTGAATLADMPILMLKPVTRLPAAGRTHPGTKRKINEDALLLRGDVGVWAVADGVGGHEAAEEASRTVMEHLDQLLSPLSFGGAVDDMREMLQAANTALRTRAAGMSDTAVVASTVVVLLAYAGHFCLMWSGDSRGYRMRNGQLECLTTDHSLSKGGVVTHAVGAEETLFLDQVHGTIEPDDCFLLCSDGLVKALQDEDIEDLLGTSLPGGTVDHAADGLMQEALVAGARDKRDAGRRVQPGAMSDTADEPDEATRILQVVPAAPQGDEQVLQVATAPAAEEDGDRTTDTAHDPAEGDERTTILHRPASPHAEQESAGTASPERSAPAAFHDDRAGLAAGIDGSDAPQSPPDADPPAPQPPDEATEQTADEDEATTILRSLVADEDEPTTVLRQDRPAEAAPAGELLAFSIDAAPASAADARQGHEPPDPHHTPDSTEILQAGAAAGLADEAGADGGHVSGRAWFDRRLRDFNHALLHTQTGRKRPEAERQALAAAARDMISRVGLANTEQKSTDFADSVLQADQLLVNTYFVRALIARGGVGEIYRARHRDLKTEHAIKILLPRYALDPTVLNLMLEEARLLQRVRHEAVVGCQGLLRDTDGRPMLVMDYLRGPTLSARLRRGRLAPQEVATLAARLASGLAAVHAEGLVHQDISPDNIILVDDSCAAATIIDFGLARSLDAPENTHRDIDFAGKFSWCSPEQLSTRAHADARSDLYSLGLVLAAAAKGARLDMGSNLATARAARQSVPPLDGIEEPVAGLLRHLLAPSPGARLSKAEDVAERLQTRRVGIMQRLFGR